MGTWGWVVGMQGVLGTRRWVRELWELRGCGSGLGGCGSYGVNPGRQAPCSLRQDEGVVGAGGAAERTPPRRLPAHPTPQALPSSPLLEVLRRLLHLQGPEHLLQR